MFFVKTQFETIVNVANYDKIKIDKNNETTFDMTCHL